MEHIKDVHTSHCCTRHGCKYGDIDCTVCVGGEPQEYPCEDCVAEKEQHENDPVFMALKAYVMRHYNAQAGAFSVDHSMGNYDDVFSDGFSRGEACALSDIAKILELDVPPLHEQATG